MTRGERSAQAVQDTPRPRAERQSPVVEQRDPGEAQRDIPAPPTRPANLPTAERAEAAPPPPAPTPPPRPQPPREPARAEPARAEPAAPQPEPRPREAQRPEPKPEQSRQQLAALAEQAELQAQRERAAEEARAAARARAEAEARAKARAEAEARAKTKAEADAREAQEAAREAQREAREKAQAEARAKAEADARAKAAADAREAREKAQADARAKAAAEAKAKRDAEQAARFNANDISRLLQSREQAQSTGSSGSEVNRVASLGTQTGSAQRLNPSMRSQLVGLIKEQLERCWSVPIALQGAQKPPVPSVRVGLNRDGSLSGAPSVVNASSDPLFRVAADSALTATRRCAPLRIPAQFHPFYADWSSIVINFDARDVL
jgi:colicin import membrane protein